LVRALPNVISPAQLAKIRAGYAFSLVSATYKIITARLTTGTAAQPGAVYSIPSYGYIVSQGPGPQGTTVFTYGDHTNGVALMLGGHSDELPAYIIIYNFRLNGTIDPFPFDGSSGTVINSSEFSVEGVNMGGIKFLQSAALPSAIPLYLNSAVEAGGVETPLYMVNPTVNGSGMRLNVTNGRTLVRQGNNTIFDTNAPPPELSLDSPYVAVLNANAVTASGIHNLVNLGPLIQHFGKMIAVIIDENVLITFKVQYNGIVGALRQSSSGTVYNGVYYPQQMNAFILRMVQGMLFLSNHSINNGPAMNYTATLRMYPLV
jgi:hypothetical protein